MHRIRFGQQTPGDKRFAAAEALAYLRVPGLYLRSQMFGCSANTSAAAGDFPKQSADTHPERSCYWVDTLIQTYQPMPAPTKRFLTSGWILLTMLAAAVIGFRYFWRAAPWLVPPSAVGGNATVADKIAAASALFSILAFVGLLYTILLQQDELRSQREDQEQVQAEVAEQRSYLKAQAEALTQQAFENTFFHLLRLHNDNVRSQTYTLPPQAGGTMLVGRQAFTGASAELIGMLAEHKRRFDAEMSLEEFNQVYADVCERNGSHFGHYFRNLYHIVKYVDESTVADKTRYTSQVRAQLSQAEFEVLFCNGLRRGGRSKFKPHIERYSLLHEMRMNAVLGDYAEHYKPSAFGTSEFAG